MADYPTLIPQSRSYSLGQAPASMTEWLGALEVVHRFADAGTGHRLTLTYDDATTDAEWLQIRNHWAGQEGGTLPFAIPAQVWCGHTDYQNVVSGLQWRYASPPSRSDRDGRLGSGTVELAAERSSQALLSDDSAPWFGTAVPLVAAGSDPGPPPPVVPVGTPEYVLLPAPVDPTTSPVGQPSDSVEPPESEKFTGTPSIVYGIVTQTGPTFTPEPTPPTPAQPSISAPLGRQPLPGDPLLYTPQCTNPGDEEWYFLPDVDECDTSEKTAAELTTMLKDEYGITPPSGMSKSDLGKLYCKAAEASDYGILTFKNDTTSKLQEKIEQEKSKGRQRGQPIEFGKMSENQASTPMFYGGGRIIIKDNCGTSAGNWQQLYPVGSNAWKGRTVQRVMVRFSNDFPSGDVTLDSQGNKWGTLVPGAAPSSTNGFFIDNRLLWTYDDNGNAVLLGGGPGGVNDPSQVGWVLGYKIIQQTDEYGASSGTWNLPSGGEWTFTPASP